MLNEFLSVSKKIFRSSFIVMSYDSVLQTIGMLSTAIFLWVGANQVINGSSASAALSPFSSLTAMAYAGSCDARRLGQHAARFRFAEPAQRYLRTGTGTGARPLAIRRCTAWKAGIELARSEFQIWRTGSAQHFEISRSIWRPAA
jgi:hypothetical protein